MKKYIGDILLFLGAISVVAGVVMIYVPAAFIVGGTFVIFFAYLKEKEEAQNAPVEKPGE